MYAYVRAVGAESDIMYYVAVLYFMLIVVLGNIILFSLFVAILLENFDNYMNEQIEEHKDQLDSLHPDSRKSIT